MLKIIKIQEIVNKEVEVHLFCREYPKIKSKTQPFIYCGILDYLEYDNKTSKPVHIIFESLDYDDQSSLDHLLIETDSPYLAPVPMRGKSNEPSFVKYTGEFLAEFYSMPKEKFFELTDNNFYKLFSRAKRDN